MGLMVHSLENIPETKNRDYFIYLLDYGWDEPISKAIRDNFDNMAKIASKNRSVVIKGTELAHFENEVFSWHKINNEDAKDLLPALLITNTHPRYFRDYGATWKGNHFVRSDEDSKMKLIIIPFKKFCKTSTEVITLIQKIFEDIDNKKDLSSFQVAKELKQGNNNAIVDALILEPNFYGVGLNIKKIINYVKKTR